MKRKLPYFPVLLFLLSLSVMSCNQGRIAELEEENARLKVQLDSVTEVAIMQEKIAIQQRLAADSALARAIRKSEEVRKELEESR